MSSLPAGILLEVRSTTAALECVPTTALYQAKGATYLYCSLQSSRDGKVTLTHFTASSTLV